MRKAFSTPASDTTRSVYYSATRGILGIVFSSGEVYEYQGVAPQVFSNYKAHVIAGESSGQFFNRYIKDRYPFNKK